MSLRQFCKVACCSALAVGGGWLAKDRIFQAPKATEPKLVAHVDEVPWAVTSSSITRSITRRSSCG
jgi:hypothetical protein